jgi:hypothetical protein
MPLASASLLVNCVPSATIVSRFGVLPDVMPVASQADSHTVKRRSSS